MMSQDERKQLWTMGAAIPVVLVGVAITVSLSNFVGLIITVLGSLILGVGGIRIASAGRDDERRQLWIVLAGAFIGLVGFATTVTSKNFVGPIVGLIGTLVLGAGCVMMSITSKAPKPRVPKSVEEQRQRIRAMADEIKQKTE